MTWPACGIVTFRSRATSGSRPMMTNSPVPIAKPPTPIATTAGQNARSSLEAIGSAVLTKVEVALEAEVMRIRKTGEG